MGAVRSLMAQEGRDISIFGSPSVARQLIEADLVDEYRLFIEPITLGGGKRLFPDDTRARTLELVSTTVAATGVIVAVYRTRI